MKYSILAAALLFSANTQANDLVRLFDPCAYTLSSLKKERSTAVKDLETLAGNPDAVGVVYLDVIKAMWIEQNSAELADLSKQEIDVLWKITSKKMFADMGGRDTFNLKASEKALSEARTLDKQYGDAVAKGKRSCKTDFFHSAGRVTNNLVKVPLSLIGGIVGGEEGAKAGENLGKYVTLEKNPLKAIERNWIRRPGKEISRVGRKWFGW